jgi:thioredoxin-related protein
MKLIISTFILFIGLTASTTDVSTNHKSSVMGMAFFEGSWDEALAMAQKENKLIFLDAYAAWCGPCKLLKKNVFPLEEVGGLYNEHFINVAIDMEKGIGPELARSYKVTAYPTLLFIDGNGKLIKKAIGYHPKDQFIALGKEVLSTQSNG